MRVIRKVLKQLLKSRPRNPLNNDRQPADQQPALSMDLNENLQDLNAIYANCSDVVMHDFLIAGKTKALLVYIEGLSNLEMIDQHVLAPLMQESAADNSNTNSILQSRISVSSRKNVKTFAEAIEQISNGNPVLLVDQQREGIALGLAKWEKRGVEEPVAESVIRGPREGFTETLGVNTSLLRRKIKSPALKMKSIKVGRYTQTEVVIAYIEGLAASALIEEVENRIGRIDMDGILESGYIEEMIEDSPYSPFPQLLSTERPDVATGSLLEGRVVILVDGTPFVLVAPTTLASLLHSPEDYYQRFLISTLIRWLRYLFFLISLIVPSAYVAILTYHQEMIPTTLLISVAKSREEIPFPAIVEAFLMEVTFEALREAGVRLPKQVGAAVSIVGALVIGQAATSAGLVSAPMVMVVAMTGIASFMIPHYTVGIALRMLRFPIMILAGILGLLGLMLGVIIIVIHLCTLRSFGVPYLSPLAPRNGRDLKDVLFRAPLWKLDTRPRLTGEGNTHRQAPGQKPNPTKGGD
ncbi:spore germination protein [Cohnella soli]|uniref:Spore germination protein n=1 Tax=Cohnella soli TaxID=425005 RepID=A0ABW0I6D8_9BACL